MRLFIATSFPAAVTAPLNERLARVKSRLPAASWVRPETQHLTFAFLGEHLESVIDEVSPLVASRVSSIEKFEATLKDSGFFPNPRHARVGWVGAQPPERFGALARAVREGVEEAGLELDRNEFRPHLTLMRIRDRWPPLSIETFNKALADYVSPPFTIDHVTLYSSQLSPNGALHTPQRQFALA